MIELYAILIKKHKRTLESIPNENDRKKVANYLRLHGLDEYGNAINAIEEGSAVNGSTGY